MFFASSSVESTSQGRGDGVEETNLTCGSWWCLPKTNQPSNNENEIEKKRRQLRRSVFIIISMANLISAILASLLSFEIFTPTKESPLAMALSFRWLYLFCHFRSKLPKLDSHQGAFLPWNLHHLQLHLLLLLIHSLYFYQQCNQCQPRRNRSRRGWCPIEYNGAKKS